MRALPLLLLAGLVAASAAAQRTHVPRPAIPLDGPVDVDELLRLARVSQAINARTYFLYSFRQTSRREELDAAGETKHVRTKVYRVVPSRQGTIRHLLEQDGEEPSPRQVKKQLARNEKLRKRWAKIRAKQEKQNAKKQTEAQRRAPQTKAPPPEPAKPTPLATQPSPSPAVASAAAPTSGSRTEPTEVVEARLPRQAAPPAPTRAIPVAATPPPADLPELPTCDLEDPGAAVRPPLPGSTVRSRAELKRSAEDVRKARNSTGDYTIFELLSLTNYEYQGACEYEERAVHLLRFWPAEDFDPQNPVERVVTAMEGSIFVDAADIQVMRIEGRTIAPIKWGAGMVALRSAHVIFENRKVKDEVWLPAASVSEFDSRVIFDNERERFTTYFDDYKKLVVSSTEEFVGVAKEEAPGDG